MEYNVPDGTTLWTFTMNDDRIVVELGGVGSVGNGVSLKKPCHAKTVWLYFSRQGQIALQYKPKGGM